MPHVPRETGNICPPGVKYKKKKKKKQRDNRNVFLSCSVTI